MKNIVFIGHYRDGTGYGHAAENYIKCISQLPNVHISPVWISLLDKTKPTDLEVEKLEQSTNFDNVDTIIYCTLPQYFVRKQGVKNIGIFFTETDHFKGSNWHIQCNMMDEIWVSCQASLEACKKSGVTIPVHVIPIPFQPKTESIKQNNYIESVKNKITFYTISEISYRKNILGLVAAYYSEFSIYDNVALVIKGFHNGKTSNQSEEDFSKAIEQIKAELKTGYNIPKPPILYISEWLSEKQIEEIHYSCDCYVTASRGEAYCLPLIDAINHNNYCIGPNWGGPKEILADTRHRLINGYMKPVFGMSGAVSKLYWGDELWFETDLTLLKRGMRDIYNHIAKIGKKQSTPFLIADKEKILNKYSFDTIGTRINALLTS